MPANQGSGLDDSGVRRVWLLIVLVPGFGFGVWLLLACSRASQPGAPGFAPAPTAPGVLLSCRRGGSCWSGGCGQCGQPLPAGQERLLPRPVRADLQDALPGVPDEAGGDVPEPVTQGIRLGVLQALAVVKAEEPGAGGQARGGVPGQHPADR